MIKVKNNVSWCGKIDWELRKFHGEEYSTKHGSTYNSYLIEEEKVALVETVWAPFSDEFVKNLSEHINLAKIDYVIVNHAEVDHSGALPTLMRQIPDTPIYCTANCVKSLKGHYHRNWNFNVVKTGDRLSLGSKELVFIEAPMLHWPDTMYCYLTDDNILFSNDAFGQHYATEYMFNDLVDNNDLMNECLKYYANILTPFSKLVTKKITEILSFKLPLDMICTSHGVIWRDNPVQIVEKYLEWADDYQEDQITILYDTMWNATRQMAEHIAKGISAVDEKVNIKLFNVAKSDKNDIISEVFKSKGIIIGSSTINKGILSAMAGILEEIRGLSFKKKKAACFGSYGWSGESVKMLEEKIKEAGFDVAEENLKIMWVPDKEGQKKCFEFGSKMAYLFK